MVHFSALTAHPGLTGFNTHHHYMRKTTNCCSSTEYQSYSKCKVTQVSCAGQEKFKAFSKVRASTTCPEAELVEVGAAAVVGFAQVVAATVWWLELQQLKAPVPT